MRLDSCGGEEVMVKRALDAAHVRWTKNLLNQVRVGGVWGIPRSGLLIRKTGEHNISIRLPETLCEETAAMLKEEVAVVSAHAVAAGYSISILHNKTQEEPSDARE